MKLFKSPHGRLKFSRPGAKPVDYSLTAV